MKIIQIYIITFLCSLGTTAQAEQILQGKVCTSTTEQAIPHARILIVEQSLWTFSNNKGEFLIPYVNQGKLTLEVHCLGYAEYTTTFNSIQDIPPFLTIRLKVNNLLLDEVRVTAQKKTHELTTSYLIKERAIAHLQSTTLSEIMAQLPGASTTNNLDLTNEKRIAIRDENDLMNNSSLGSAIEIDGIRVSNTGNFENGSFENRRQLLGSAINNISTNHIESIEIISGLPSVEYGDLTSGLISIKTKKGPSPYEIRLTQKPKIKAIALQKGFVIKNNGGMLNVAFDHTRSFKNRSSPYETYLRNNIHIAHQKEFTLFKKPLILNTTLAGNVGGYNTMSDPDMFTHTYQKTNDHQLRAGIKINYLINQNWIKNIELQASSHYANKKKEEKNTFDSSSSTALIRTQENSYAIGTAYTENPNANIVVIPRTIADSTYYSTLFIDNQPINYKLSAKSFWHHRIGHINTHLKLGGEYTRSGNYGQGEYYADKMYTAIDYRPYKYHSIPFINNLALYAESKLIFPILKRDFKIQLGLRRDYTHIHNAVYGAVSSYSPRANMSYIIRKNEQSVVKLISMYAGIGDAVKLPSIHILYPKDIYYDHIVFSDQSDHNNTSFPAYHTQISKANYNPDLNYERIRKAEIGLNITNTISKIALTLYHNKTFHPYKVSRSFSPYTYNETDNSALDMIDIAPEDRIYAIDPHTGVISITNTNNLSDVQILKHNAKTDYITHPVNTNASSDVKARGLEWIITFNKIKALNTSIRIDGAYSIYKRLDQTIEQAKYCGNGHDEMPYKYIGYYVGRDALSNGVINKRIRNNCTFITHIPQSRLVISLRLEASLYDYQLQLSEYNKGTRSYIIDQKRDNISSNISGNIYSGDYYVATAPLYYTSYDNPDHKILFYEQLVWASEHDLDLYNDLVLLIKKTPHTNTFKARKYSPYFSANLNITKELNDHISLSFLANNIFNNMANINNSQNNTEESLYNSSFVPQLYYGLSLRIKL